MKGQARALLLHRPFSRDPSYINLLDIQQIYSACCWGTREPSTMKSEVEIQYNNRARIAETPQILRQWSADATAYREQATARGHAELNVQYGAGPRHIVDVFWPAAYRAGAIR